MSKPPNIVLPKTGNNLGHNHFKRPPASRHSTNPPQTQPQQNTNRAHFNQDRFYAECVSESCLLCGTLLTLGFPGVTGLRGCALTRGTCSAASRRKHLPPREWQPTKKVASPDPNDFTRTVGRGSPNHICSSNKLTFWRTKPGTTTHQMDRMRAHMAHVACQQQRPTYTASTKPNTVGYMTIAIRGVHTPHGSEREEDTFT